ncbi:putative uncharacterised protein [Salmonella phage Vi01]|uniref:Uncharacterized protein n=1 Tax=Salmonella phage ViI TaxID=1987993 RepID=E1XT34_BPSAV|nr:putative uncharacterised protein [Salmonella phage Vi01]CBW37893.1 putative uncharacterised protein [Salmonella phage Vi01]
MKLSQCERDEIIGVLERAWKYEFQTCFVVPLISRLNEVTEYRFKSAYHGLPNTPEFRFGIERELMMILERWCEEAATKYRRISRELLDKKLFWLKVVESDDPCALNIQLSPTILDLYNGVSSINVFDWSNWSDAMLKNAHDRISEKERI